MKWKYYLMAILFFTAGFVVADILKNNPAQTLADTSKTENQTSLLADNLSDKQWVEVSPSPKSQVWQEIPIIPTNPTIPTGKFIIKETQKITAGRTIAETGEEVYFSTSLKNIGDKKKFLTHICFQYNGGNFGCILNTNLDPGQEFSFGNLMTFTSPGAYNVWVTWSQDHTNFSRPLNSSTTTVIIQ